MESSHHEISRRLLAISLMTGFYPCPTGVVAFDRLLELVAWYSHVHKSGFGQ